MRVFYNFVLPRPSLKFGKVERTAAMQAGTFDRALTIRKIPSWVPPAKLSQGRKALATTAGRY